MQYDIKVRVKCPPSMRYEEAGRLVQRLIDVGFEDAANSPDDCDDPDKPVVNDPNFDAQVIDPPPARRKP